MARRGLPALPGNKHRERRDAYEQNPTTQRADGRGELSSSRMRDGSHRSAARAPKQNVNIRRRHMTSPEEPGILSHCFIVLCCFIDKCTKTQVLYKLLIKYYRKVDSKNKSQIRYYCVLELIM